MSLFQTLQRNEIIPQTAFCTGCFRWASCSQESSMLWQESAVQAPFVCLFPPIIFHGMDRPDFAYPFSSWWTSTISTYCLFSIMLLWIFVQKCLCGHRFSFHWSVYIQVKLLDHGATLTFWGAARWLARVAPPFCIPSIKVWGFSFFHILVNTCNHMSFLSQPPQWA